MNTYGVGSINITTFNGYENTRSGYSCTYPEPVRNVVVTFFKIHNLTLNILGYLPGMSAVSGCVRIGTGCILCTITLLYGQREAESGLIIRHFYDEALLTGITQIARGALEALIPFGWIVNASLDALGSLVNLHSRIVCWHYFGREYLNNDPVYPFPFSLLHLV